MAGPYAPSDDLVGPIIRQIAQTIRVGIPSIEHVFDTVPDRAPSNNQVLLPLLKVRIKDDTNGKLKMWMDIGARHVFRRQELDAAISQMYTYVMPWLRLLAAWPNQTVGGLAIELNISDLAVTRIIESGQVFPALATNFSVLTEFNIDLT